jgi:hypothetical protein
MIVKNSILWAPIILSAGCAEPLGSDYTVEQRRQLLSPIMADKIELVGPLTQPASFDDDIIPEGLEAVLVARDRQGEPTKISGQLVFELYAHRPAAADPRGPQIQTWELALAGDKDQATYWNHTTLMYEFKLQVDKANLPKGRKFVLLARYIDPWNEHMENQAIIDLTGLASEIRDQVRGARAE